MSNATHEAFTTPPGRSSIFKRATHSPRSMGYLVDTTLTDTGQRLLLPSPQNPVPLFADNSSALFLPYVIGVLSGLPSTHCGNFQKDTFCPSQSLRFSICSIQLQRHTPLQSSHPLPPPPPLACPLCLRTVGHSSPSLAQLTREWPVEQEVPY